MERKLKSALFFLIILNLNINLNACSLSNLDNIGQHNLTNCGVNNLLLEDITMLPQNTTKILMAVDATLISTVNTIGEKSSNLNEQVDKIVALVKKANKLASQDLNLEKDSTEHFLKNINYELETIETNLNDARKILDQSKEDVGIVYCKVSTLIKKLKEFKQNTPHVAANLNPPIALLETKLKYVCDVLRTLNKFYGSFSILIESSQKIKEKIIVLRIALNTFYNETCPKTSICRYKSHSPILTYIKLRNDFQDFLRHYNNVANAIM